MGWGNILSANDAVSSVISVILMVGVVVILGAVLSVFALGMAEGVDNPAPSSSFEFKILDDGDIEVTHASGDQLNGNQLRFAGAALEKTTTGSITEWSGGDVTAGDLATVNVEANETLLLIWQSPDSDETATLAEYDVPAGAAPTASIGSVDTGSSWPPAHRDGEVIVQNVQFSRVSNDNVYVVVDDEPGGQANKNADPRAGWVSTDGGSITFNFPIPYAIDKGETLTVTVYETDQEKTQLAQCEADEGTIVTCLNP